MTRTRLVRNVKNRRLPNYERIHRPVWRELLVGLPLLFSWLCGFAAPGAAQAEQPFVLRQVVSEPVEPDRKTVFSPLAAAPPVLDGKLDDACWQKAARTEPFCDWFGGPAAVKTEALVTHDEKNLYIAYHCQEPEMANADAKPQAPGKPDTWSPDCVELFIDHDLDRATTYQIVTNMLNTRFDGAPVADWSWNGNWKSVAARETDFWTVEIAVPAADFGFEKFEPGQAMGLDLTRERAVKPKTFELQTWTPTFGGFANPSLYGTLVLGTAEQYAARLRPAHLEVVIDRERYSALDRTCRYVAVVETGGRKPESLALSLELQREGKTVAAFQLASLKGRKVDLSLDLGSLQTGEYALRSQLAEQDKPLASSENRFHKEAGDWKGNTVSKQAVAIRVPKQPVPAGDAYPITTGVPFPKGALWGEQNVRLVDSKGGEIPCQTTVRSAWDIVEGGIRWLGLDYQSPLSDKADTTVTLEFGTAVQRSAFEPMKTEETPDSIAVDTGVLKFRCGKRRFRFIDEAWLDSDGNGQYSQDEQIVTSQESAGSYIVDEAGRTYFSGFDANAELALEETGPLRTVIKAEGWHVLPDRSARCCKFRIRIYAYKSKPYLRVFHTFIFTEDSRKVRLRDIGLATALPGSAAFKFASAKVAKTPAAEKFPDILGLEYAPETVDEVLPAAFSTCVGQLADGERAYYYQKTWENAVFRVLDPQAKTLLERQEEKFGGWFSLSGPKQGLTVSMRNSWKLYPKEFEVEPSRLVVHFWPRHADPAPKRQITRDNLFRMWFCHEGELLDFTVPNDYIDEEFLKTLGSGSGGRTDGLDSAHTAQAAGLAKTHELLYHFHPAADSAPPLLSALFQEDPHGWVHPQYACGTGVFGWLHPKDDARFPALEKAVSRRFDFYQRVYSLMADFGMFNYADEHTYISTQAQICGRTHRLWKGTHHRGPSGPWLLYIRSGDPKYLRFAVDNTRHVLDCDICHYRPEWAPGKVPGGGYHCKGYVHWHNGMSGTEVSGHNILIDFALYDYFITGNRFALDVAQIWGQAIKKINVPAPSREGIEPAAELIELYQAFQDSDHLVILDRHARALLSRPLHELGWFTYGPFIDKYHLLTGNQRIIQMLKEAVDKGYWDSTMDARGLYLCGAAYMTTGDARYLDLAMNHAAVFADTLYENPHSYLDGNAQTNHMDFQYFEQRFGIFLAGLAKAGKSIAYLPEYHPLSTSAEARSLALHLRKTDGAAGKLTLKGTAQKPLQVKITGPGGKGILANTVTPQAGKFQEDVPLPESPEATEYSLDISSEAEFTLGTPVAPGMKEVYAFPFHNPSFRSRFVMDQNPSLYILVPEECDALTIEGRGQVPVSMKLFDLQGNILARNDSNQATRTLEYRPLKAERGKTYRLLPMANSVSAKSGPSYFSFRPENLFVPQVVSGK